MLVIHKERGLSYDDDWKDGFGSLGARFTEYEDEAPLDELTVILHSVTAQWGRIPDWIYRAAEKRTGKLVLFLGNEFKKIKEKRELAVALRADVIATQLRKEDAERIYQYPVLEVPHALNADYFKPGLAHKDRPYDMGVRGNKYPAFLGDNDRNNIHDPNHWRGLTVDMKHGMEHFALRKEWAKLLGSWRTMPSCEGGMIGGKCVTSRHFDAIGSHTCLVMYPGHYNGILDERHYIRLERDHSNIEEVKEKIKDVAFCEQMVTKAREYLVGKHTHKHRAKMVWDSVIG